MWLVAQAEALPNTDPMTWIWPLLEKSPLLAVFALVIYLCWTWVPKVGQACVDFITSARHCNEQNASTLKSAQINLQILTDSFSLHDRVPKMLGHMAEAGKAATVDPEVRRHLDRALDERDR